MALGASGNQQAGILSYPGAVKAVLWSGSANSWVDLGPPVASESGLSSVIPGFQGGYARISGADHAVMWTGWQGSWVDLHPAGAIRSSVTAVSATKQGGWAVIDGLSIAGLWSGSAVSWIPLATTNSAVLGMAGDEQVGYTADGACLWRGSSGSRVDLNGTASYSVANGTDGVTQVGGYRQGGSLTMACMWSGTAATRQGLHPPTASTSVALAVAGEWQCGYMNTDRVRAVVWRGPSVPETDLHQFLPQHFIRSYATGIAIHNGITYVTGYGETVGGYRPLLWRNPAVPTHVSGIIGLNDVVWNPAYPRPITIRVTQNNVTLGTRVVSVGTTGAFGFQVGGAGQAVVLVDGPTQLTRRKNIYLDGNPIDLGVIVLNNGDCDGSGEVDAADIDVVIAQFGSMGGTGDVDLSGEVDAADIDICIANFGAVGD